MSTEDAIVCHVIAGPLGVGKTTAIIDYLQRHAEHQQTAVLVNDFGPVGLDGAIIKDRVGRGDDARDDAGPPIISIPGGCICCAAAEGLIAGLTKVADLPAIDRIIVEPSGLAAPAQVIDLLRQMAGDLGLEVRPVIVLLDVATAESRYATGMPYYTRMVEAADILIGHRADLASDEQIESFGQWANQLYPPRLHVGCASFGQLGDALFEMSAAAGSFDSPAPRHDHDHDDDEHRHPESPGGLQWPADVKFDQAALLDALRTLTEHASASEPAGQRIHIDRLKGIFHTDRGWQLIEIAAGQIHCSPCDYRLDNRVDWIIAANAASPDFSAVFNAAAIRSA